MNRPVKILVVYGTTEGQTARVARVIAATLRLQNIAVDVANAKGAPGPDGYDGVIVAASIHAGGYQRPVTRWVRQHARALEDTPNAFVSVCLAVLQHEPEVQRELTAIIDRFGATTGWRPETIQLVAGALPYTKYNWLKRWIMRRIVAKAGGDTDTTRDYEYTNWADVHAFAEAFGRDLRHRLVGDLRSLYGRDVA